MRWGWPQIGPFVLYTIEIVESAREAKDGQEFWEIIGRTRHKMSVSVVLTFRCGSHFPDKLVPQRRTRLLSVSFLGLSWKFAGGCGIDFDRMLSQRHEGIRRGVLTYPRRGPVSNSE